MSGAGDQSKQLRDGVEKVEDLRDEEEHHCLAEVAKDPDHSKRHPSKVAVGVSHKHTRGVPTGTAQRSIQSTFHVVIRKSHDYGTSHALTQGEVHIQYIGGSKNC